jgi:tricarballylate dehydrogenase
VLLLEAAPREWRGGNSMHTRNLRCMHDAPQDVLTEAYPEEEFWQDLLKVTGGRTDEALARLVIRASATCRDWMRRHGVRFQPSLSGTLHLSAHQRLLHGRRQGAGQCLLPQRRGAGRAIRYDTRRWSGWSSTAAASSPPHTGRRRAHRGPHLRAGQRRLRVQPRLAARGLGPERARRVAGRQLPDPRHALQPGRAAAHLLAQGADTIGDPTQAHMVAIDARAPLYDGGICTRVDCVSLGMVVNRDGERFYDEGEDFWPKRYAIWGRLVAQQPGQVGHSIIDAKAIGRFMPPVFPGVKADTLPALARKLGLARQPSCRR